jgi:hypothetical protein
MIKDKNFWTDYPEAFFYQEFLTWPIFLAYTFFGCWVVYVFFIFLTEWIFLKNEKDQDEEQPVRCFCCFKWRHNEDISLRLSFNEYLLKENFWFHLLQYLCSDSDQYIFSTFLEFYVYFLLFWVQTHICSAISNIENFIKEQLENEIGQVQLQWTKNLKHPEIK